MLLPTPQQSPQAQVAFTLWILKYLLSARLLPCFDQEAVNRAHKAGKTGSHSLIHSSKYEVSKQFLSCHYQNTLNP